MGRGHLQVQHRIDRSADFAGTPPARPRSSPGLSVAAGRKLRRSRRKRRRPHVSRRRLAQAQHHLEPQIRASAVRRGALRDARVEDPRRGQIR